MYVSPFVCGVVLGSAVTIVLIVTLALSYKRKEGKKEK